MLIVAFSVIVFVFLTSVITSGQQNEASSNLGNRITENVGPPEVYPVRYISSGHGEISDKHNQGYSGNGENLGERLRGFNTIPGYGEGVKPGKHHEDHYVTRIIYEGIPEKHLGAHEYRLIRRNQHNGGYHNIRHARLVNAELKQLGLNRDFRRRGR